MEATSNLFFFNNMNATYKVVWRYFPVCVLLILGMGGCGPSNMNIHGKVTFADGQPLKKGIVCFESDKVFARGEIDTEGNYTLGSLKENDGLPAGTYRVYINGAHASEGIDANGMPIEKPLISSKYASVTETDLSCTVDKNTNRFDIVVEKP